MKTVGIIAEYNPFHRGHAWQLRAVREKFGPDCAVITALGGCFTQRGDPAVFTKYARAEAALRCGADLVLELPLPWAASSAEGFARGGVGVLNALGNVDTLVFGSECADIDRLNRLTEALSEPDWEPLLREKLRSGAGYAKARQQALEALLGEPLPELGARNDILAVEYLRALNAQQSEMQPCPLPRNTGFPPASKLRQRGDFLDALPDAAAEVFRRELAAGRVQRPGILEASILARLRSMTEAECALLPGASEGLENRLRKAAWTSGSMEELLQKTVTKRYPAARVRRMALSAFLGVPAGPEKTLPPYIRVLGLNERGRQVLHDAKPSVPLITKPADGKRFPVFQLEAKACALYALGFENEKQRSGDMDYQASPVVIK